MALKDHINTEADIRIVETNRDNYELGSFIKIWIKDNNGIAAFKFSM